MYKDCKIKNIQEKLHKLDLYSVFTRNIKYVGYEEKGVITKVCSSTLVIF